MLVVTLCCTYLCLAASFAGARDFCLEGPKEQVTKVWLFESKAALTFSFATMRLSKLANWSRNIVYQV